MTGSAPVATIAGRGPVLAIQSFVAAGRVGHRAGSFALERLGHEVVQIPTTLLSGHAATPGVTGHRLAATDVASLLDGVAAAGLLTNISALLTGYLGSPETAVAVADFLARLPAETLFLCDPVLGDTDSGLYLPEAVGRLYRERLLKRADIAVPNAFELGWLTGRALQTPGAMVSAARSLGPATVYVTSVAQGLPADRLGILAVTPSTAALVTTPRLPVDPKGAGDLCAALLLAAHLQGASAADAALRAAAVLQAIIARNKTGALDLVAGQALLTAQVAALPAPRIERLEGAPMRGL
ncbi:MAG: pyridoxal kinase [Pseudomonadota bacterium]